MPKIEPLQSDQLSNATRREVFNKLLLDAPVIVHKPLKKALKKPALYQVRN